MTETLINTVTTTTAPAQDRARRSDSWKQDVVLSATRAVVGLLFFCHGLQGTFGAFGGVDGKGTAIPFGIWPFWWAGALEMAAGALVAVGLYARSLAVLASGMMAYAYFTVHQPMGALPIENMGEPAAMFSWVFLLIAVLGPGRYALDALRRRYRGTHG